MCAAISYNNDMFLNIFSCVVINNCESRPCQNGAICDNSVGRYACRCAAGYAGVNCQTGKNLFLVLLVAVTNEICPELFLHLGPLKVPLICSHVPKYIFLFSDKQL